MLRRRKYRDASSILRQTVTCERFAQGEQLDFIYETRSLPFASVTGQLTGKSKRSQAGCNGIGLTFQAERKDHDGFVALKVANQASRVVQSQRLVSQKLQQRTLHPAQTRGFSSKWRSSEGRPCGLLKDRSISRDWDLYFAHHEQFQLVYHIYLKMIFASPIFPQ